MKIKKLNESMLPSQATLDDCLQDYRENAFGFNGVEDYVDTNYPMHPQEFKAAVCDYLKNHKNESLNDLNPIDESRFINEAKTGYQYKGHVICYGYKGTDRWYVKDSSNNFVGTKSGYSTEVEAKEYVDDLNESVFINEDNNIEDELAQFKKDLNSCVDLRGIEVIIANISDEDCKTAVKDTFKKTNINKKNLPEIKNTLFATYEKFIDDNYTFFESNSTFGAGDIINESLMGLELDKDDILDWLAEHEQAWADAERHFSDSSIEEVSVKDLVEWIADHKQLYDDFHRFFYEDNLDEEFLNFDFNQNPDDDIDGIIQ